MYSAVTHFSPSSNAAKYRYCSYHFPTYCKSTPKFSASKTNDESKRWNNPKYRTWARENVPYLSNIEVGHRGCRLAFTATRKKNLAMADVDQSEEDAESKTHRLGIHFAGNGAEGVVGNERGSTFRGTWMWLTSRTASPIYSPLMTLTDIRQSRKRPQLKADAILYAII